MDFVTIKTLVHCGSYYGHLAASGLRKAGH